MVRPSPNYRSGGWGFESLWACGISPASEAGGAIAIYEADETSTASRWCSPVSDSFLFWFQLGGVSVRGCRSVSSAEQLDQRRPAVAAPAVGVSWSSAPPTPPTRAPNSGPPLVGVAMFNATSVGVSWSSPNRSCTINLSSDKSVVTTTPPIVAPNVPPRVLSSNVGAISPIFAFSSVPAVSASVESAEG